MHKSTPTGNLRPSFWPFYLVCAFARRPLSVDKLFNLWLCVGYDGVKVYNVFNKTFPLELRGLPFSPSIHHRDGTTSCVYKALASKRRCEFLSRRFSLPVKEIRFWAFFREKSSRELKIAFGWINETSDSWVCWMNPRSQFSQLNSNPSHSWDESNFILWILLNKCKSPKVSWAKLNRLRGQKLLKVPLIMLFTEIYLKPPSIGT